METVAAKVTFLHREPVAAAYYVLPEFVPLIRAALSTVQTRKLSTGSPAMIG
jgi:hypothetical protein